MCRVYSFFSTTKRPVVCHTLELKGIPGIPQLARQIKTLHHGDHVSAVAIDRSNFVYTGGKGSVKIWDIFSETKKPLFHLDWLEQNSFVRSIKLLPNGQKFVVGGEAPTISLWDLGSPKPRYQFRIYRQNKIARMRLGVADFSWFQFYRRSGELELNSLGCYALAVSSDGKVS